MFLEKYQAHSTSEASILPVIKKYWSDIKEPCLEKTADCKRLYRQPINLKI